MWREDVEDGNGDRGARAGAGARGEFDPGPSQQVPAQQPADGHGFMSDGFVEDMRPVEGSGTPFRNGFHHLHQYELMPSAPPVPASPAKRAGGMVQEEEAMRAVGRCVCVCSRECVRMKLCVPNVWNRCDALRCDGMWDRCGECGSVDVCLCVTHKLTPALI